MPTQQNVSFASPPNSATKRLTIVARVKIPWTRLESVSPISERSSHFPNVGTCELHFLATERARRNAWGNATKWASASRLGQSVGFASRFDFPMESVHVTCVNRTHLGVVPVGERLANGRPNLSGLASQTRERDGEREASICKVAEFPKLTTTRPRKQGAGRATNLGIFSRANKRVAPRG